MYRAIPMGTRCINRFRFYTVGGDDHGSRCALISVENKQSVFVVSADVFESAGPIILYSEVNRAAFQALGSK